MAKKKEKSFWKKIPHEIWAIVIVGGIGLFLGYSNASIQFGGLYWECGY
ncbi:hypothetical protein BMS3Abin17_01250 [archaeon BMS3Abin17]|nr:hypothetical protein BMS3Abin17_01250 [archaeon BMS3Abin17]